MEIILSYNKEDMDSIFSSVLICSVALEQSLSSLSLSFIPLQKKRVHLSTPKHQSLDNCGTGSVLFTSVEIKTIH